MNRDWLPPVYEADFDEKGADIHGTYKQAPELTKQGQPFECVDEMTGVQALERKHPGLPLLPGTVERTEFEYERHGTLSFICSFDVALGELTACTARKTRNEKDYLEQIQDRVASDPLIRQWHFINATPSVNTHMSASLVR